MNTAPQVWLWTRVVEGEAGRALAGARDAMTWPTTRWGLLDILRNGDEGQRSSAMGELISLYGPPLFAFARHEWRSTLSREDCEDLVADFFVKCLQQVLLERADPAKGRFRSYLAKSFKNFGLNEIRDGAAGIRSPRGGLVSLHELIEKHGLHL